MLIHAPKTALEYLQDQKLQLFALWYHVTHFSNKLISSNRDLEEKIELLPKRTHTKGAKRSKIKQRTLSEEPSKTSRRT